MELTVKLGEEIIRRLSSYVDASINLMNSKGIIIASTDPSRLGEMHGGARLVCKTRKPQIITASDLPDFPNAKPGVNLPVHHRDELAGVVGMTGDPEVIMQAAKMTLASVEIALEQVYLERESFTLERIWANWLRKVLLSEEKEMTSLKQEAAHTLQIDADDTWQVALFCDVTPDYVKEMLQNSGTPHLLVLPFESFTVSVFPCSEQAVELPDSLNVFRAAVGTSGYSLAGIRSSYYQAKEALNIFPDSSAPVYSSAIPTERLLYNIDSATYREIADDYSIRLKKLEGIYIHTLHTFLENNMRMNRTSSVLHIHRNTLTYRLDRIQKIVGLDPRAFQDAIICKTILICAFAQ